MIDAGKNPANAPRARWQGHFYSMSINGAVDRPDVPAGSQPRKLFGLRLS
jgi:hypothetical protein